MKKLALFSMLAIGGIAIAGTAITSSAIAGPVQTFSTAALHAAQKAGKPILVDVHADWCPTCRAQAPTIAAIAKDSKYAQVVILKLDFDKQVNERTALGARKQSTLIVYKGTRETGRATGITDPAQIKALVATALK